jgi:hypothetical protein
VGIILCLKIKTNINKYGLTFHYEISGLDVCRKRMLSQNSLPFDFEV